MQVPLSYHGRDVRCSACKSEFPALHPEERPFSFDCPYCDGSIEAEPSWIGISAPCPHCQSTIVIPNRYSPPPLTSPSPPSPQHEPPKPPIPTKVIPEPTRKGNRTALAVIVAVAFIALAVGYPRLHNSSLREHLESCETHGVVGADVYYASQFASDVIVFDLKAGSSSGARRIDPVHLLLQFAAKLDFSSLDRVILANDGKQKFYVGATDLKELASSYDAGGRIWSLNHLPERCRMMSGTSAYDTWTGGWLGVAQRQADDLNSFIDAWTGY